uniref:Uncharacterized protein n=1 Tax=Siphoviridae sp. ctbrg2 TaxID=2823589 RepID=A0A8S5LFR9_9CAUD|nr:MAG TPA: hypothetical protein [Siphoviridae sp. ctbrg2]
MQGTRMASLYFIKKYNQSCSFRNSHASFGNQPCLLEVISVMKKRTLGF